MDSLTKPTEKPPAALANGIYVRGVIVSNRAKSFKRKDGSGISVVVEHEIATQPGVAIWVLYFDPKTDTVVRLEGDIVIEFPKTREFQQVTIRANKVRFDEHTGQLIIKSGELVA